MFSYFGPTARYFTYRHGERTVQWDTELQQTVLFAIHKDGSAEWEVTDRISGLQETQEFMNVPDAVAGLYEWEEKFPTARKLRRKLRWIGAPVHLVEFADRLVVGDIVVMCDPDGTCSYTSKKPVLACSDRTDVVGTVDDIVHALCAEYGWEDPSRKQAPHLQESEKMIQAWLDMIVGRNPEWWLMCFPHGDFLGRTEINGQLTAVRYHSDVPTISLWLDNEFAVSDLTDDPYVRLTTFANKVGRVWQ